MRGRVCMVTGATNGIGEITALELARMGATVVIIGRNEAKAHTTIAKIKSAVANADVDYLIADLSLMRDVKKVAEAFFAKYSRLDVLVNNAGLMVEKRTLTTEGLETTFAVNHMSYFYLTQLLLNTLKTSGTPSQKSRVVNVSSSIHQIDKSGLDDIQLEKGYNSFKAYRQSKMMNIWFTYELARRFASENAHVTANTLHPGTVRTNFGTEVKDINGIVLSLIKPFFTTPEKGAQTQIYLASSPEVEGVSGGYFIKSKPATPNKHANNTAYWSHLWAYSEGIIQKLGLEAV